MTFLHYPVLAGSALAHSGGSNYGVAPGLRIAVMFGNLIARSDTKAKAFREWELPELAKVDSAADRQGDSRLPTACKGRRDPQGRYRYVGSHNGRPGMIE